MYKNILSAFLMISVLELAAQSPIKYLQVAVHLDEAHPIPLLASLGVEVEHAQLQKDRMLVHFYDQNEVETIIQAGFKVDTLIADYHAWYQRMLEADAEGLIAAQPRNQSCHASQRTDNYPVPANYQGGSVGGYVTYNQMLSQLHAMHLFRPDLITDTTALSNTLLTHEGRRVYMLRLSDNPQTDEADEPEVLYTSLHHAREPNSLSQLLFFMWYLLENYDTDPLVKAIVDHTELYFVPCVNPDGYIYNETTNPNGGGLWRKNRRNNGNNFGVDLNRNYGYKWGLDNTGSSPSSNASTYRGPSAFSEPETQLLRNLCQEHNFVIALNNHTYSNLWNFVWGYTYDPVVERPAFEAHSSFVSRHNSYPYGAAELLYLTNGVSDDWMYGDLSKNKIYAYTPEVGPGAYGFWPPPSQITRLNQEMMTANLRTALSAMPWADTRPYPPAYAPKGIPQTIEVLAAGVSFAEGQVNISLSSLHPQVLIPDNDQIFTFTFAGDTQTFWLPFTIDSAVPTGTPIGLVVQTSNGFYTQADTVFTLAGQGNILYQSTNFADWVGDNWQAIDGGLAISNTSCPNGDICKSTPAVPVQIPATGQTSMVVRFRYDVEAAPPNAFSIKAGSAVLVDQPLCGWYCTLNEHSNAQPVYKGYFSHDVQETFDISSFAGQLFLPVFELQHAGNEENSVFISSIQIVHAESTTSVHDIAGSHVLLVPNPTSGLLRLNQPNTTAAIQLFNHNGQRVYSSQGTTFNLTDLLPDGIYYASISIEGKPDAWQTVVLAR
jgi:hypothetical protein